MMRDGQVFELPMQEPLTTGSEYLSLPTPTAQAAKHSSTPDLGSNTPLGANLWDIPHILPTPRARDSMQEGYQSGLNRKSPQLNTALRQLAEEPRLLATPQARDVKGRPGRAEERNLNHDVALLPTPNTMDSLPARSGEARERQLRRGGSDSRRETSGNLREDILELLLTVTTQDSENTAEPSQYQRNTLPLNTQVMEVSTWGKFQPAIERWEQISGRPAPAPTKPDGKDGAHRLSSEFAEWMMGILQGWVTDCGLSRNAELKACGNGVVPQQAALALRLLLGQSVERERERVTHLPTPTVSDIYTDRLTSTQQTEGSMHSVTLPQIVKSLAENA